MKVLVVSSADDLHMHAVAKALQKRGATVELLDLSEFPASLMLTMEFDGFKSRLCLRREGGGTLDLRTIGAVWWRRPQPYGVAPGVTEQAARRFALSETATAFSGLFHSLDAFWINDPGRDEAAHHKPWQLAVAQRIGLALPETLMTSDPKEALDFWLRHSGNVIYKVFRSLPDAWRETRKLKPEDETMADKVRLAPVIFQRFIEAVADIRVTIVGSEVFAAAADARGGEYPIDFRFNSNLHWERHRLPASVEGRLLELMARMELEYGAIDLRLTPEGEYAFLEINPAGQFLWIEQATGQQISEALAAHLQSQTRPRLKRSAELAYA